MTDQKDNNNGKSKFSLNSFFYGIIFSTVVIVPFKDGRYKKLYNKYFGNNANSSISHDRSSFKQIDKEVAEYRHYLFNKHFGRNSMSKAKEYYNDGNYSNQLNPNNDAYWQSRGYEQRPKNWEDLLNAEMKQAQYSNNNYSNQLNPNNDAFWQSRGYSERPDNWQSASAGGGNAAMNNHANQMNPNNAAYHSSRGGGGKGK